jgi:hypothetical protein
MRLAAPSFEMLKPRNFRHSGRATALFASKTHNDYVHRVKAFAAFLKRSADTATAEDLRTARA